MNHKNHIPGVELELAKAKKAATPIIVECTERSRDRVVFEDRTHGTTRVVLLDRPQLGGSSGGLV